MTIYHMHHIVPKYMGGTDDPSNLVKLTIEEHAQAHFDLYEKYGDERDHIAGRMLLGQISTAEARLARAKLPKTEAHKKKMSEAKSGENNPMFGKKHSAETRALLSKVGMGNKNPALMWEITTPEGETHIVKGTVKFSEEHNLDPSNLRKGKTKGYTCRKLL